MWFMYLNQDLAGVVLTSEVPAQVESEGEAVEASSFFFVGRGGEMLRKGKRM